MSKIAPKGDVFAGGQILNQRPVHGKISSKQTLKDNETLSKLGVQRKLQQRDAFLQKRDNPLHEGLFFEKDEKCKKRISELNQDEKIAVKKVTSTSEDLAKKLLAPTPGSRALIRHLVNAENEKKAMVNEKQNSGNKDKNDVTNLSLIHI